AAPAPAAPAADDPRMRIQALLAEGQEAFQQGDNQGAIDIWSRIFLIDVDNDEASRRIEAARDLKAERERQAEELYYEAVELFEAESFDEARDRFERTLELDPNHGGARAYIEQIDEAGGDDDDDLQYSDADPEYDDAIDAALKSAAREEAGAAEGAMPISYVAVKKTDKRLVAIGALVALLVIGGGAFLATQWNEFFPNAAPPAQGGAAATGQIDRAQALYENGQVENAVRLLERISTIDPSYRQAQTLLTQWRSELGEGTEETDSGIDPLAPPELSPEDQARLDLLLNAARDAYGEGRYIRASRYFERAKKLRPLEPDDAVLERSTAESLEPLREYLKLFEGAEYTQILPDLWRERERDPGNPDIDMLIVDSYFNLALQDLQRGDAVSAVSKLEDALEVDEDNRDLLRLLTFSRTYGDRQQDLLYRIFVKYTPTR
ncbi:MAG: hypothetical protein AAF772_12600, partial [Acidobacteriota bacterium]